MPNRTNRREFLQTTAAGIGFFVAAGVQAAESRSPNERIAMASIGIDGKGDSDSADAARSGDLVAICDVDDKKLDAAAKKYPKAKKFNDFRKMLETMGKSIDAVTVSTPDHVHAPAAAMAMKMGKHAFVQKPLTHTIYEARKLGEIARQMKVATQMGNQGTAESGLRRAAALLRKGIVGRVTEVHVWTNRPIWPQGGPRPAPKPVPPELHWDEWLGPAPERPYGEGYHPFAWRGWWDFGTGALGDMGAHIMDQPFWALKLKSPVSVQASSTVFSKDYAPAAEVVTYEFAAREGLPPLTLTWWDGGLMPPRPPELEQGRMVGDDGGGVLFRGDKGLLMCGTYGENPRLVPESRMQSFERPAKTIPRSAGIRLEWFEAIKKGAKSTTDFSYSGPLTETMLLANVAVRLKDKNMKLLWDGEKMEFTNLPEANELLHFPYRPGWSL